MNARFGDVNNRFKDFNKRFDALNKTMNARFEDLNKRFDALNRTMNARFEGVNKRLDDMHQTTLALFGTLVSLIVALFGYIAWDRRTLVRPLQEKLNVLEQNQIRETQNLQKTASYLKSHVQNIVSVLRKMAQEDKRLASLLRSFSLL